MGIPACRSTNQGSRDNPTLFNNLNSKTGDYTEYINIARAVPLHLYMYVHVSYFLRLIEACPTRRSHKKHIVYHSGACMEYCTCPCQGQAVLTHIQYSLQITRRPTAQLISKGELDQIQFWAFFGQILDLSVRQISHKTSKKVLKIAKNRLPPFRIFV